MALLFLEYHRKVLRKINRIEYAHCLFKASNVTEHIYTYAWAHVIRMDFVIHDNVVVDELRRIILYRIRNKDY